MIIGILLLIAVVYLVSKVSDRLRGNGGTIWKIVLLIVIAAIAFWFFGDGYGHSSISTVANKGSVNG